MEIFPTIDMQSDWPRLPPERVPCPHCHAMLDPEGDNDGPREHQFEDVTTLGSPRREYLVVRCRDRSN